MGCFCSCFRGQRNHHSQEAIHPSDVVNESFSLFFQNTPNNGSQNSESVPVSAHGASESANSTLNNFESIHSNHSKSSDMDICPTCFEEYSDQNPKIIAKCNHHYHLGCIYDWMERSQTCPACRQVMTFDEVA
ncbi:hypothetical protein VNO77_39751 [Canavalia gladiata]|uniref:RING-type E3 ubiquitin transferase n=1 Tax=Canavalia gladiata TaxID=3824 RepID=A0AAN9JZZ2_CANGL